MKDRGSIVRKLDKNGLIEGIKPFAVETHYEVIMGSFAYGVSNDTSDVDVYGLFIPPIDHIFPHTSGHIMGFGPAAPKYDIYQKHHIELNSKEYDLALYNIVKYFQLCAENNPNMIDSLFVPSRCIIHSSDVGDILRENRRLFLHKGIQKRLSGYAYAQLKKLRSKTHEEGTKRSKMVEEFGYDVKFAYHILRLCLQAEMVMTTGDLDLEANREILKSVRRGEWTLDEVDNWFKTKEKDLDELYVKCDVLPYAPDYDKLKQLLMQCLEAHFGSLSAYFNLEGAEQVASDKLKRIKKIIDE